MKTYQKYCYYLLILLLPLSVFAQTRDSHAEWGEYEDWELNMTSYDKDTSAVAVVLSEYGVNAWRGGASRVMHRRIKILDEAGVNEYSRVYIVHGETMKLRRLKARLVYLDEHGKTVIHEVEGDDFLKNEQVADYFVTRFTFPHVQVGAIIEYKYELISDYIWGGIDITTWRFQKDIPVLWSEYKTKMPSRLELAYVPRGTGEFFISESRLDKTSGPSNTNVVTRLVMKDLPAQVVEPAMPHSINYMAMINLYPNRWQGYGREEMLGDWKNQAETFLKEPYYGGLLGQSIEIRKLANRLVQNDTTKIDKMRRLYNYVRANITTDNTYDSRFTSLESLDEIMDGRTNSRTEANLLFIDMMLSVGLQAKPVLISTARNGLVRESTPTVRQFNRVIAGLSLDGSLVLLDASDIDRPWNVIPEEALSGTAFVVDESNPRLIPVVANARSFHQSIVTAKLDGEGVLSASIRTQDKSYDALGLRQEFHENYQQSGNGANRFVYEEILKGSFSGELLDATVSKISDVEMPFKTSAEVEIEEAAQLSGEFMYFNPFIFDFYESNPFPSEDRQYPVDFKYQKDKSYIFTLTIPEGYAVESLPENRAIPFFDNKAVVQRLVQVTGNMIQFSYRERWNEVTFDVEYYPALRAFYDEIIALQQEQIVLKKIDVDPDTGSAGGE